MFRLIRYAAGRALRSGKVRPRLDLIPPPDEGHVQDFAIWYGEQSRRLPYQFPFDRITSSRLIEAYSEFCVAYGLRPMSDVALLRRVKSAGFQAYRETTGKRRRFYRVA